MIRASLRAHAVHVAEDVLDVQVHLGEHLLHELHLLARLGDEVAAVAHEVTQRQNLTLGPEAGAEQTGGVELLEPGGVDHVGLLAGHAFDVAGVD